MLTSSTIHENYVEMREWISQRLLTDFNTDKVMEGWIGTKHLIFSSSYNVPTFSTSRKEVFKMCSKHVTHYDPRSRFLYYNMTSHHPKRFTYSSTGNTLSSSRGFETWGLHQYPASIYYNALCIFGCAFLVMTPRVATRFNYIFIMHQHHSEFAI